MKQLVAVAVESDQHGTFYHNPEIISDYLSAVTYQKGIDSGTLDLYVEFITYPDSIELEKVVEDIENYQELPNEWMDWLNLEETLGFFEVQQAIYSDGGYAVLGDKVLVDSDSFSWVLLSKKDMSGVVTLLDDPYYIQLSLDINNREIRIPHHQVRKYNENNNS